ncbi:MAG: hypothetical protein IPK20_15330 [Betaproteobacteria bacterium]|nr:hypothetical protein [Betaproteobacteria bacterium]
MQGNDLLSGGAGDDVIDGGAGSDTLYGQDGDDILRGNYTAASADENNGDTMFGGDGNDIVHGSAQDNWRYNQYTNFGAPGDSLLGDDGDDILYGYDGNDGLDGGDGNDRLVGGAGSDYFNGGNGDDYLDGDDGSDIFFGGFGDDTFIVGKGIENYAFGGDLIDATVPELNVIGFDTVVFEGNFADYKMTGGVQFYFGNDAGLLFSNTTAGDDLAEQDNTTIDWRTIDRLVFADRTIETADRSFSLTGGDLLVLNDYVNAGTPVTLTADGWESIASVFGAGDVTITDVAAVDELDFVRLLEVSGTTTITSDAIETLDLANIDGSVIVKAAVGERALAIRTYGLRLGADEQLWDDTATDVSLSFATNGVLGGESATPSIATAGVNRANLSFQSASTIRILANYEPVDVRWDVRNATTIDLNAAFRIVREVGGDFLRGFESGNVNAFNILTPLDDAILGTAGGSAEFRYVGGRDGGRDYVRLGNLGEVNAGNDGTEGPDAGLNAGLGLRGHIDLAVSKDEVRILGSDAFQGGTIDGGTGNLEPDHNTPDADTIRMTFGVAEAIGDISDSISNFEVLHLHATSQSHTADASNFDAMTQIVVSSGSAAAGTNTIVNVRGDSVVAFKTAGDFDPLNNQLGTIHIEMVEGGTADRVKLAFVGVEADGADEGRIVVRGAEIVEVSGNNLDYKYGDTDSLGLPLPLGPETDPFTRIGLDLENVTTVYVSGETGWDFTQPGTHIAHVTMIDASAVSAPGRLSGVTAKAQTSDSVTFIGGTGDDVFEGGEGSDVLAGGGGNDVYVLNSGSEDDTINEEEDGGLDTIRAELADVDLGRYGNIENATLTGALDLDITGSASGNRLTGNAGNNEIHGGDGGDTAVFAGDAADYVVTRNANGSLTVADAAGPLRDGVDTLFDIEYLEFSDSRFSTNPTAPTDIQLTSTTVRENAFDGVVVGKLTATDAPGDTAAYLLLDDAGGRFKIVGDEVRVVFDYLLDYEQATSYDIAVRATDLDGLTFDKTITIAIEDANPEFIVGRETSDILFGGAYNDVLNGNGGDDVLRGNGGSDILIGWTGDDTAVFSGNMADYEIRFADVYTDAFTVVDKRSDADGTGFDGIDYVVYDDHFDFPSYRAHRSVEHLQFADITVDTADLLPDQGPTDLSLSGTDVDENAAAGSVVGTLSATDPSVEETFTYVLTDDAGGRLTIVGDDLVVASGAALDFETEPAIDIGVQVTDSDGNVFARTFTLGVRDVNEAPTVSLVPLLSSLDETASTATRIAMADIAINDDALGSNLLSLSGPDAGAFEIDGTTLFLRPGLALDHTVVPQLRVSVLVDDPALSGAPDAMSGVFTLTIADVPGVHMIHGTTGDDWLRGTSGNDWFVGTGGEDIFEGGRGDDTYVLDSLGDIVVERGSQGTDTVMSSVNHWLGRAVENLVLTGSVATRGIGNEADNRITGNAADNLLLGEDGDDELSSLAGDDTLEGGDGHDSLLGGDGNDALSGEAGDDSLLGEAGDDSLDGGLGDDVLDGGAGNDTALGQRGDDTLLGGAGNDRLEGNDGEDLLDGGAHLDQLYGGNGRDTLLGGAGNDFLDGGAGNDHLSGGTGADVLVGGAGRDVLEGGAGYDLFSFSRLDDSGTSASTRDVVVDFVQGWDMFDLESLDADTSTAADDAFRFVGDTFSGEAGELRAFDRAGQTLVEADVDGNGLADFAVALNGIITLAQDDFIL